MNLSLARRAGLVVAVALLGACAGAPERRTDGRPLEAKEVVARVSVGSVRTFPGKPLNNWWMVSLSKVDGNAIPEGTGRLQLTPGEHTFEYQCRVRMQYNDTGGSVGTGSVTVSLKAGMLYYAWPVAKPTGSKTYPDGSITSTGTCIVNQFNTDNPFIMV